MSSSQFASSAPSSIKRVTISEINKLLSLVTLKLEESNFLKWNFQFQTILQIHDLFGFFDGSYPCPTKFMTTNKGMVTSEVTVAYNQWKMVDKALLSLLMATLNIDIMDIIVGSRSSHEAWLEIQERFLPVSRASVMQLETDLLTIKKGSDSIEKYLLRIKLARYQLSLVGVTILDEDIVLLTLNGLPNEFSTIKAVIRARDNPICFKDLRVCLLDVERDIKFQFSTSTLNLMPDIEVEGSFSPYKRRSSRNKVNIKPSSRREQTTFLSANTREKTLHQSSSSNVKLFCEICNKTNHVASNCFQNIKCSFCGRMGHVPGRCYNNPSSLFYKPQFSICHASVGNNLSSYASSGSNGIAEVDTFGVFGEIEADTGFSGGTSSEILDFENSAEHDGIRENNAETRFLGDNGEKNTCLKISANLVLFDRNGDQNSDGNTATSNKKTPVIFSDIEVPIVRPNSAVDILNSKNMSELSDHGGRLMFSTCVENLTAKDASNFNERNGTSTHVKSCAGDDIKIMECHDVVGQVDKERSLVDSIKGSILDKENNTSSDMQDSERDTNISGL